MEDPQAQQQIEGLPPGAILKPIQQPAIQGLPPGAILKPIGSSAPIPPSPITVQQPDLARDSNLTAMMGSGMPSQADLEPKDSEHPVVSNFVKNALSVFGLTPEAAAAGQKLYREKGAFGSSLETVSPHPVQMAKSAASAVASEFQKGSKEGQEALDAARRGDIKGAVAHSIGQAGHAGATAMAPLFGENLSKAGEQLGSGDISGGLGTTAGIIAPVVLQGEMRQPVADVADLLKATKERASSAPIRATSKLLGGGPEAMAKKPIAQQTAAGSATNAQVRDYAASKGVDLLPGQATGARGLQTVQAIGERAVVAPGELPDILEKQKAAFGNAIDDFKARVGTEAIPNTEAAGQSLKSQAQHGLDTLKQSAQQDYQAFEKQAGDLPVDLSDVKAKAQSSLASQAEALKNVPAKYANPVRNVLKKLSDLQAGPEADPATLKSFNDAVESYGLNAEQQAALRTKLGLPDEAGNAAVKMSTAQQLRSAYLDISRDYSGNVPKSVQRYAGQAAKDIDAAMAKAADQAGAKDQWRQANAKWKQLQETYNNPEHPLYKVMQEPDPSKVPSKLLGKGSYGGSPQTVRQLQQAGIDTSPLKREVAQQIADRNFALTNGGRGLAGYSTEFLKTLYTPEEFNELTTMGRVGRAIRFEMNPSGTSNVMEGHRQIHGIIRRTSEALVGPFASRLTTSKALARATMGEPSPVQPRGVLEVMGMKPPEPPPGTPPASGGPSTPNQGPTMPPAPKSGGMAAATDERGIKAPQKRTFERIDEKEIKQYFNYRFDQLRNEMKAAQATGDQAAISDVQRRMDELDQIQRQPKSIVDILGGKEKIDLNAPKSQRKIPPDVTAKADYSGQTVPAKAPTFFSKAEQVAEEKLPNSVKADQVIPTLQNAGVKAEEMKWLGLDDYLKGKEKVSKADLLEHIRENNLQVKEVLRGDYSPAEWESGQGGYRPETKFSQYQLPGGENYRELLLTLPAKEAPPGWKATYQGGEAWLIHDANGKQVGSIYGAKDAADAIRQKAAEVSGKMFQSSHFDEPNVLAHVRFNDRISPDGKKTLFLEELQSDWHQKGRREGYKLSPEQIEQLGARRQEIENLGKAATPEQRQEWADIKNKLVRQNVTAVPDAPFKSTWQELAMKRMLRYAAENGYDRLAWTTGEQQAARYDLSKHVDTVEYSPNTQLLIAKNGGIPQIRETVPQSKLADYIGKDAADKLINNPTYKPDIPGEGPVHMLSGEDLKVGGQGMKGFYDKILPDFMNKYGKKWGAKVGEDTIGDQIAIVDKSGKEVWSGSRKSMPALDPGDKVIDDNKVHSLPITPSMRKDVIFKGQPIAKNKPPRSLADIFSGANA